MQRLSVSVWQKEVSILLLRDCMSPFLVYEATHFWDFSSPQRLEHKNETTWTTEGLNKAQLLRVVREKEKIFDSNSEDKCIDVFSGKSDDFSF